MTPSRHATAPMAEYRRRRFLAPRRRRHLLAQLVKPFLGALFTVAVPGGLVAWVLFSPHFLAQEIEVRGTDQVDRSWAEGVLEPLRGEHLLWLPLRQVEATMLEHAWVGGLEVRKELPDRLVIEITERQPVALLRTSRGLFYMDSSGKEIDRFITRGGLADLVLISGEEATPGERAEAMDLVARLEKLEPAWAAGLSELEVRGEGDVRLFSAALPFPLLVSSDRLEEGVRALRPQLAEVERQVPRASLVDVRFSKQIVIQPAATPSNREG